MHPLKNVVVATALIGLLLYLWRLAYDFGDWAIIWLIPLALLLYAGCYPLILAPWRSKLRVSLRDQSPLSRVLNGKIRATFYSVVFAVISILVLAWQALSASTVEGALMIAVIFISGVVFFGAQSYLTRHFHQPFAREAATSIATWSVALPFVVIIAFSTWVSTNHPGQMQVATFKDALQIGIDKLPARRGLLSEVLAILYAYEAGKLWVVIQFKEYRLASAIFSLDAALFSFILARSSIVVAQFVETHSSGRAR